MRMFLARPGEQRNFTKRKAAQLEFDLSEKVKEEWAEVKRKRAKGQGLLQLMKGKVRGQVTDMKISNIKD